MATNDIATEDLDSSKQVGENALIAELPWGSVKTATTNVTDLNVKPGEYVAQTLFIEFVLNAERKISAALSEPLEKPLTKSLQRGEDAQFDQIITTLGSLSENCLPSVLRSLFVWYDEQNKKCELSLQKKVQTLQMNVKNESSKQILRGDLKTDEDYILEKRKLAVDFILCLVLIEVLKQLPLHPGIDHLVLHIIQLAFQHFRYKDFSLLGPNSANVHVISDLFAEVIGVLSPVRFVLVRKRIMQELGELRAKETTPTTTQNIVSLFMGLKFFRVKMAPIEDFEASMRFLQELGGYFLEVKEREIKHALAGLFIEILLPVAAVNNTNYDYYNLHECVKTEVNVPSVKSFIELLYSHTLDLATKKKHSLAFFPLLTCLLCIGHKQFFLSNWHYFLTLCLSNLKHKDSKMSRVALESLYRLVWVYVVRIKCESNTATLSRLQSICNSLFPKGGRGVMPRNAPLNIFVKILHFIAQERLDFAFKEVIFDLLCVGRPIRNIYPERMNVGLRALLVIADSLQQKDGPPPMPRTISTLPSGYTLRVRRTYLARPLQADMARNIGIELYYGPCRRAFDGILRALDAQVGRPLLMTVTQTSGKETDDLLGGERKPKIDLFRTCVAAIPRILPEGMSRHDLVEMLTRLSLHMDEELRALACQALQNVIVECSDWRQDLIYAYLQFFTKEISDVCSSLVDSSLRLLLQLLSCWKNAIVQAMERNESKGAATAGGEEEEEEEDSGRPKSGMFVPPVLRSESSALALHCIEGFALTMLCQNRSSSRKLAITILKEVKSMLPLLCSQEDYDIPVIDVLDSACSYVVQKYVQHIGEAEKMVWLSAPQLDFLWLSEKIASIETNFNLVSLDNGNEYFQWDPWAVALSGFTESHCLLQQCPTAVSYAWPAVHMRLNSVFVWIDPNSPQNDTRASLLRTSKSKASNVSASETLSYSNYLGLWQKYLVLACAIAPPSQNYTFVLRSVSPVTLQCDAVENQKTSDLRIPRVANVSATNLFRMVLPLLRCDMTDIRDSVVLGLGSVNPHAFDRCLLDEMSPCLREACERKQENVRRKKRRDILRLQLIRFFEMVIFRGTFNVVSIADPKSGALKGFFRDFIENSRHYLETDQDRDGQTAHALHLHFAKMISLLIKSFPIDKRANLLSNELRKSMFYLFASWSGRLGLVLDKRHFRDKDYLSSQENFAVMAMCAVLTCGHVFDAQAISDETGYIFGWLDALVQSQNKKISELSEETLMLLLEFNSDSTSLLDWVIGHCYTSPSHVADKCFRAIASIFLVREYPCDFIAMFNLALLYIGYPVNEIRSLAIELIQMLDQHFFDESTFRYSQDDSETSSLRAKETLTTCEQNNVADGVDYGFAKRQLSLSQQLSDLHPEISMPIFSEISVRMLTAKPARRASMMYYLVPWLHNVELVDPFLEPAERALTLSLSAKMSESHALSRRILKGEGWGSVQATEMVLNNLLYITVKFGNEQPHLIESLWTSLVIYWPQNLRIILRYLAVMVILSPDILLTYSKRIVVYLARVCPERMVNALMAELETVDVFRHPLERTEWAPYYRWVRREEEAASGEATSPSNDGIAGCCNSEPMACDALDSKFVEDENVLDPSGSVSSLLTLKAEDFNPVRKFNINTIERADRNYKVREYTNPFQLPMPAYGGYYCQLCEYLPAVEQPVALCHRCFVSVMFLTDLVLDDAEIDWSVHLPLMLHVSVLGLDHNRSIVNDHCKQLLVNLTAIYSKGFISGLNVTRMLNTRSVGSSVSLLSKRSSVEHHANYGSVHSNEAGPSSLNSWSFSNSISSGSCSSIVASDSSRIVGSFGEVKFRKPLQDYNNVPDLAIAITTFLSSREGTPLWLGDESRCARSGSLDVLSKVIYFLDRLFSMAIPSARIESRWAQTALHIAVCCPIRHYAGRSFQILRALRVPLSSRMINDILSRLVEVICEHNEDMRSYVAEVMLTFQSSVLHMEVAEHSLANLFKPASLQEKSTDLSRHSPSHQRSTSCFVDGVSKMTINENEGKNGKEPQPLGNSSMARSKSAHAINSEAQDEHLNALSQLLWIAVSLLESDVETEFALALKLLDRLLDLSAVERQDCFDRLARMTNQLNWSNFPGVLDLVLKGCTFSGTYEITVAVVVKLILLLDCKVVDMSGIGLAMSVVGLLPYAILHYDEPTKAAIDACEAVANCCIKQLSSTAAGETSQNPSERPLEHLATIMRLYKKRSFRKECSQWTKCILKYLTDEYANIELAILTFLTEMLDRGLTALHPAILHMMNYVFTRLEFTNDSLCFINGYFLKVVSKHVQGPFWKEASTILNLAVSRSSSFSKPSTATAGYCVGGDSEFVRKELPGRTMEFRVDLSHVDALKSAASSSTVLDSGGGGGGGGGGDCTPRKSLLPSESAWKKPLINQVKVREHLISLLNASGLHVGLIRSPSIIFSQSSHDVACEQMSSAYSSSGELTAVADHVSTASPDANSNDLTSETYAPVFKEFDFLDGERDSLSESAESCFNWLSTLRPQQIQDDTRKSPAAGDKDKTTQAVGVELSSLNSPNSESDFSDEESNSSVVEEEEDEDDDEDDDDDQEDDELEEEDDDEEGDICTELPASGDLENIFFSDVSSPVNKIVEESITPTSSSICESFDQSVVMEQTDRRQVRLALNIECSHHCTGQIEETWNQIFSQILINKCLVVHAELVFTQLLREIAHKMSGLVRDVCHFLSMSDLFHDTAVDFLDSVDILMKISEFPFLFISEAAIQNDEAYRRHKYYLMELKGHYEAFQERREHTIKVLNSVKSALKLQLLGTKLEHSTVEQLCYFCSGIAAVSQFAQAIVSNFSDLRMRRKDTPLRIKFVWQRGTNRDIDLTENLVELHRQLLCAANDLSNCSEHKVYSDASTNCSYQKLSQHLHAKEFKEVLVQLRSLRVNNCRTEMVGCCEEVDVEVLLLIYCQTLAENHSNFYAVIGNETLLEEACNHLMELNITLSSRIRWLVDATKKSTKDLSSQYDISA
ncbi:Protein furry -like protein-like [Trichinella sp. T8]|nr:Protein furry -like protein-like [Trichinella sp. T8]